MRRAIVVLSLIACLAVPAPAAPPVMTSQGRGIMNGIGELDYTRRPTFKPGDWVRYHVTGINEAGVVTDYLTTILIAGEERFWGDDCFWVETWTQPKTGDPPSAIATLMSYSIFDDSLPVPHLKYYMRKSIVDVNPDGSLRQDITVRPQMTLRTRKADAGHTEWTVDTTGTDTVSVPRGLYPTVKVVYREGVAQNADYPDSTVRMEVRETRTLYTTARVPITGFAREHIDNTAIQKHWLVGHSQDAKTTMLNSAQGDARLDDFGGGLKAQLIPEANRRTIKEQDAAAAGATRKSTPTAKPTKKG